jgi:hypothetical protein
VGNLKVELACGFDLRKPGSHEKPRRRDKECWVIFGVTYLGSSLHSWCFSNLTAHDDVYGGVVQLQEVNHLSECVLVKASITEQRPKVKT